MAIRNTLPGQALGHFVKTGTNQIARVQFAFWNINITLLLVDTQSIALRKGAIGINTF